jgi:hypothetical protein
MTAQGTEEKLEELARRLDAMERELLKFQSAIAGKLAQALRFIQKREQLRDKRLRESLREVATELSEIKERLSPTPRITH